MNPGQSITPSPSIVPVHPSGHRVRSGDVLTSHSDIDSVRRNTAEVQIGRAHDERRKSRCLPRESEGGARQNPGSGNAIRFCRHLVRRMTHASG